MGPLAGIGVGRFTIGGRRDSKSERTCDTLARKIDDLTAFLRDPVLEFMGESGELRGAGRPHPPSRDCFISVPPHPRPLPPGEREQDCRPSSPSPQESASHPPGRDAA